MLERNAQTYAGLSTGSLHKMKNILYTFVKLLSQLRSRFLNGLEEIINEQ